MQAALPDLRLDATARVGAEALIQRQNLEHIFTRYLDPVYRFLYRRVGNREDAEDLTSHVFLKASQQLDTTRTESSVATWLFTVARTVLADHWRRYYRDPQWFGLNDEITAEQPFGEPDNRESRAAEQLLEAVLQALPARYRRVLELRFLEGYAVEEAAREMGVTPGNFKVLQHRALARAAAIGLPDQDMPGGRRLISERIST
jgi:RNA polymerase sigma-70 factor (ECF subfamily)